LLFDRGVNAWVVALYPKIQPWIMGMRRRYNDPLLYQYSEYLYNEVMRIYPEMKHPPDLDAPQ
jgi:hypothetical protein